MHRILVFAAWALIMGILAAQYSLFLWTFLFAGGLVFYGFFSFKNNYARPWPALLLLILFFLAGLWRTGAALEAQKHLPVAINRQVTVVAQICAEPEVYPARTVYTCRLLDDRGKASGDRILLNVRTDKLPAYRYGDILQATGWCELPKRAKNPGEFDYRQYLRRQGILVQLNLAEDGIQKVKSSKGNLLKAAAFMVKDRVKETVYRVLHGREGKLFLSVFFGDKGLLSDEQKELFSHLGIMHVFAVSGSNVAVVLSFLWALAVFFRLKPLYRNLLFIGGLLFYAVLTGLTPSVLRATVMALGLLGARWFLRKWDVYAGLAAAVIVLLLYNPFTLFDSGFQLSFVVTWGLVYLTPFFDNCLGFLPAWRIYLTVILAAQAAALPLTAYYFNIISLAGLVTNLLVVPVIGIVVILGMAVLLLTLLWPPLAWPFIYSAGVLLSFLVRSSEWLAQYSWIAVRVATPSLFMLALSYLGLVILVEAQKFSARTGNKGWTRGAVALCCLLLLSYILPVPGSGKLEVTFLDVGQGDAIFIETPGAYRILLDGGGENYTGTYNAGAKVVVPYLTRRGVFKLDAVISTHPDGDHLAGLGPVLKEVKTGLVLTPPVEYFGSEYASFLAQVNELGRKHLELRRGSRLSLDEGRVVLEVLHPANTPLETRASPDNNNCLVLRLVFDRVTFLLTGDIEAEGMAELLKTGQALQATVFKIPHHGSKYAFDEEFCRQVQPRAVVFCVGKNNFGHPAQEIINYWEELGKLIYRTDWDGAITFRSDGKTLHIETMGREEAF